MTEESVSRDRVCTLKSHSGGAGATEHRPALLRAQTPPGTLVGGGCPQSAPWALSKLSSWG